MKFLNLLFAILLLPALACAQDASIVGTVTNQNGNPLIGVTVLINGTTNGTVTEMDGTYSLNNLNINTDYELFFSYLGYENNTQTVKTTDNKVTSFSLRMKEAAFNFDEIIVKSTRAADDAPFTYTNVSEEEIEKINLGQDIPFLLRWTPSAVVSSDAGTGIGYTGIRIRGVEPNGINVTINGIPLNDSESQGVFWVNMPDFSSSTSSVQVQRGVGTSTNGAGAFGASININTAKDTQKAFTEVNGTVGSFGTMKGNVQFGTGMLNDKFSFGGRVSSLTSDGYIDRASVDLNSYFLTGAYHGKRSMLRINAFSGHEVTYQAWNGVPVQYGDDDELRKFNSAGTARPGEPHNNEVDDYTQSHYQMLYSRELTDNFDLSLAGHYTRGFGFFENYEGEADFAEYGLEEFRIDSTTINSSDLIQRRWLDNHFYGTTYSLGYTSTDDKLQMTLGGAWNQYLGDHFGEVIWSRFASTSEQGSRYYENRGEKTDFNIYLKTNYVLSDKLNAFVDLQYRALDYSIDGRDNNGRDITQAHEYGFFNPKAGLFFETEKNLSAYASFAVGNREPNRGDFTDAPIDADGNRTVPMHETLYDTELGVKKSWRNAAISANFYYMDYKNALIPTGELNDVGASIRTNTPKAYRAGIELVGGIKFNDFIELNTNLTLSQNRVEAFDEFVDNWDTWGKDTISHTDTDLALSPNLIKATELTFHILPNTENHDLSFSISDKLVGKQYLDNTSNESATLPSYWFLNSGLRYTLRPKKVVQEIAFNFMVRNLTNAQFSTAGWIYRFNSPSYNPIADDPYARSESGEGAYNLTGLYPQAGVNYLLGVKVRF